MKGVLYRSVPPGSVIDLAHDLPAQNVPASAFLFRAMARPFPHGSVHVGVVDPGVGGARAPVAIRCRDGTLLVGPDNGLLSPLAEELGVLEVVRLRPLLRDRVGATFDGRDLFAPAAALLAAGTPLSGLGSPHALRHLSLPEASRERGSLVGCVLWVDPFGNLITNIPSEWLPGRGGAGKLSVNARPATTFRMVEAYEQLRAGELGVLASSFGVLELSARGTSAAARLHGAEGQPVVLSPTVRVDRVSRRVAGASPRSQEGNSRLPPMARAAPLRP
jgi:S-adenosylmethionine hydrolase